jgi:DNA-binding NarL/FixJ family response regulator
MTYRVLIADEDDIVRAGLRLLLGRLEGFQVVGEAIDGRAAVQFAESLAPDIILLDVNLPGDSGTAIVRSILKTDASARILVVSTRIDHQKLVDVLDAGAAGFVLKDRALAELPGALRIVIDGGRFLSSAIANGSAEEFSKTATNGQGKGCAAGGLSPRERQVLQLVAEGKTNKQAALMLSVSTKTIEAHRAQLMGKLGIRTVAGLTKFAVREGITSLHI